ncbi:hypothetical protein H5410_022098, partial [Solanum commersonii]
VPHRLSNKLPNDEALQRFNVHGPPKCSCCEKKLSSTKNRVHSVLIHNLPLLICWKVLKARCSHKYLIKCLPSSIINHFLKVYYNQQWRDTVIQIEKLKPMINIKYLRCSKSSPVKFKLNTDRCIKGNQAVQEDEAFLGMRMIF